MYRIFYLLVISLIASKSIYSQTLKGVITDSDNNPIPYSTVYVKEIRFGTNSNENGQFELKLKKGEYTILFQSLGFESAEKRVILDKGINNLDVSLKTKSYQIQGVKVSPGKEDPAYAIIRKAIGFAPFYQNQISKFDAEVYIKGSFKFKKIARFVKMMAKREGDTEDLPKEGVVYLSESLNEIKFTAPETYDQTVKHVRSNFPNDGGDDPMQFINASLYQPKLGEIILPLSPYAFNHYKYRYEGFNMENGRVVNKIKVIPKRKSRQLLDGYIYIADDYWNLHAAELSIETIFGMINIHQSFSEVDRNVWLPVSHYFEILGKLMGNEFDVRYTASVKYKEISINTALKPPSKFPEVKLAQEISSKSETATQPKKKTKEEKRAEKIDNLMQKEELTNKDMYQLSKLMSEDARDKDTSKTNSLEIKDRGPKMKIDSLAKKGDSTLWQSIRPVALTSDELEGMKLLAKESLKKDTSKTAAADSISKKPKILSGILWGETWTLDTLTRLNFSGILSPDRVRFNTVDGFVYGVGFRLRKKHFFLRPTIDYAFNRKTLMGNLETGFEYLPLKRGSFTFKAGSISTDFNKTTGVSELGNSVASLFFRKNYMMLYENQFIETENRVDLANGLQFISGFGYYNRKMLENSTDFSFYYRDSRDFEPNIPVNDSVYGSYLEDHQALLLNLSFNYTPRYFYRIRVGRKIMSHSKYPTFIANTTLAIPKIFNSDAKFLRVSVGIFQNIKIEPSNEFSYRFEFGKFVNSDKLFFPDYKHFNTQEIPVVLSDFSNSFQLLPYYSYSSGTSWAAGHVKYESPYMALKYLPFLSKRFWKENLYASWLYSKGNAPYYEIGYAMSQIGLFGGVGVFVGFTGKEYYGYGIKASITFGNEISI